MKLLRNIVLVVLFCKVGCANVNAQIDTLFWFATPWVTPDHDGNTSLAFRISTFSNPSTVRMQQPAMSFDTTFTVPANSLADVPLDYLVNSLESQPADALLSTGMKITSTENITVVYDFISDLVNITPGTPNNPETYSLKGQNGMGTEFVTPFQTLWDNKNLTNDRNGDGVVTLPKQYFSVVATEDNTTIHITPNCAVIGHPADVTYSVVLPTAGSVYTCENITQLTSVAGSNLSGSIVVSDKPVAVTINDDSVNPSGGGGCFDLMGDQIVPTDVIGQEYIINEGFLNNGSNESIFIIASENFTTVSVDDGTTSTQLLNQGETYQYSIDQALTFVSADKPVYVVHMSGYGCELGMAILPPLNCAGSDEVSFARNNDQQFLLNILCEAGNEGDFVLNGSTTLVPAASFNPVPGTGGAWVGTQIDFSTVDIPVGSQNTITNGSGYFSLGVINGGPTTGCLYHYMSSFNRKVFTNAGPDFTLCSGESIVNLSGTVIGGSSTGVWQNIDGTGSIVTPSNLATTYNASPGDFNQGSVTFVLSSSGVCEPVRDTVKVSYVQAPISEAGIADTYCANNVSDIALSGGVNFASGGSWSGGNGGSFHNSGSLNTFYTPSAADLSSDSILLYLTSAGSLFSCPDHIDSVTFHITPAPVVNPGPDLTVCSDETSISLNGLVSGATTTGEWTTNGFGSFNPSGIDLTGDYLISANDVLAGGLTLTLASTNNGMCLVEKDSIQISFLNHPDVDVTSTDSVCASVNLIDLTGTISNGFGGTWTTDGFGTIVTPGNVNTQYNVSSIDTTQGFVDFYLTTGSAICPSYVDSVRVHFIVPPQVNAGIDLNFCNNEEVPLLGTTTGNSNSGFWTSLGTGTFNPGQNTLSTYYDPSSLDVNNGSVQLLLTSDTIFGCPPDIDTMEITFKSSPLADFSASSACQNENTSFTDASVASNGSINFWTWTFDNGNTTIAQNPLYMFSGHGNYDVELIVGQTNGCFDTIQQTIVVHPAPIAIFTNTVPCETVPVDFTDLSFIPSGTIVDWTYNFGSQTVNAPNTSITFPSSGSQIVTLSVTSNFGCVDDTTVTLVINPSPFADFNYNPSPALLNEEVEFTDVSQGNPIDTWYWDFGDGQADNSQNPDHNYSIGGTFDVLLEITDINGCIDTMIRPIVIALPPVLPTGFSPNGDGENDRYIIRGGPFKSIDFQIYNNWGELVYSSVDQTEGWDGDYKGVPAALGVYTWKFVVTMLNDQLIKESGDVTLIR